MNKTKKCKTCGISKDSSEFYKHHGTKDKLDSSCKLCVGQKAKDHYSENKTRVRDRDYRKKYGITLKDFNAFMEQQKGLCAICHKPETGKALAVDHCHKNGTIRGLLCQKCNTSIGQMEDCPDRLRQAALYLERFLA